MKASFVSFAAVAAMGLLPAMAQGAVTVELTEMHICCKACVRGIEKAVGDIPGVTLKIDADASATQVEAPDAAAVKKVLEALAAAGYHAKSSDPELSMPVAKAPEGKVTRLVVEGAHNCCGGCSTAIADAAKGVDGVAAVAIKPKAASFVVEGEFSASALVAALNAAGFHVSVGK